MGLDYPAEWKFESMGFGIPPGAVSAFFDLVLKIAGDSKSAIENFKSAFGETSSSSSLDWAISDLDRAMKGMAQNAAAFVDSMWSGIESAASAGLKVPSPKVINGILDEHGIPLRLERPNLVLISGDAIVVESGGDTSSPSGHVPLFKLGEQIGAGGYGVVYCAFHAS